MRRFIFKYSPRPGTVAIDRFTDDVPEEVKKRRNNELLAVQTEMTAQNNAGLVGQTLEVMVEGESKLANKPAYPSSNVTLGAGFQKPAKTDASLTQLIGRTRGDQIVCFDGSRSLKGKLVDVEITSARNLTLFAREASATAATI